MLEIAMEWPGDWVDPRSFEAWLAAPGRADGHAPERRADLYLACACARGHADAITAFEATYFREIEPALVRARLTALTRDDLAQRLRLKLFVSDGARPPAIDGYSGTGSLAGWFRAIVTRAVLDLVGRDREKPVDETLFDALATAEDTAETSHLREVYRAELRASFAEACARLTNQERNLLRYAFVEGLGIDEVAAVYKIHRATAARRLATARESVGRHLRDVLTERLAVSETDLQSIVRLVLTSVDLSIARYLGAPAGGI